MEKYLAEIIIFLFAYFAKIQCDTTQTSKPVDSTGGSSMLASTATNSYLASLGTSTLRPSESHGTSSLPLTSNSMTINSSGGYSTSSNTINSSLQTTSMPMTSSLGYSISSNTINSSLQTTSMVMNPSMAYITSPSSSFPITSQIRNVSYYLTYKYNIDSPVRLKNGNITNDTVLTSVQNMVRNSFNLPNFIIYVTRVEIKSLSKASSSEMITYNQFQTGRTDCDTECIKKSTPSSTPADKFTLPAENGALVDASATSSPSFVDTTSSITTTTILNYQQGESPPGAAGRLGMGLGISFIGILLIGEIIFLSWKYGLNNSNPTRRSDYELPSYNH